jgi:hypothetical protein
LTLIELELQDAGLKQPYLQYQTLSPTELIGLNQMAFIPKPEVAQIQVPNESKFITKLHCFSPQN